MVSGFGVGVWSHLDVQAVDENGKEGVGNEVRRHATKDARLEEIDQVARPVVALVTRRRGDVGVSRRCLRHAGGGVGIQGSGFVVGVRGLGSVFVCWVGGVMGP